MRRPTHLLTALGIAALSTTLVAADEPPVLEEATETFFISAGCPTDATGQCTSTRWLGKVTGDSSSNFLTAITPADEATFRATGAINWRDYPSDPTFEEYLLDDSRDIGVTVTISSHSQGGAGAQVTVRARTNLTLRLADGSTASRQLTAPAQVVDAMSTVTGPVPVEFAIDVPDDLAGATVTRMTTEVAVHGLNARNGYIDQQGGSPVTVPHLVEATEG